MRWFAAWLCVLALSACAAEIIRHPSVLVPADAEDAVVTLASSVEIRLNSGYRRTLAEGTQFQLVGTLQEGRVFKPLNNTFTVEGAHVHEAFVVVKGDELVGFYLPVERSFSPLQLPQRFTLLERTRP